MFSSIKIKEVRALKDHVLVKDMNFGERRTSGGIHLLNDDMRTAGIRPRWARVYAVGQDQRDIAVGQWVLVSHGRWTRGIKIEDNNGETTLRRVDINDVLLISDTEPNDDNISDAILSDAKTRW